LENLFTSSRYEMGSHQPTEKICIPEKAPNTFYSCMEIPPTLLEYPLGAIMESGLLGRLSQELHSGSGNETKN
ncbi:MAG: hypothetical protein ACE5KV_05710, partial [Thermoplasmata archaeon]